MHLFLCKREAGLREAELKMAQPLRIGTPLGGISREGQFLVGVLGQAAEWEICGTEQSLRIDDPFPEDEDLCRRGLMQSVSMLDQH